MENTMSCALKALKEQVLAGLVPQASLSAPLGTATTDRPVRISEIFSRADAARDDLRHSGYGR